MLRRYALVLAGLAIMVPALARPAAAEFQTYLALGDSVAYGYGTGAYQLSDGLNQGYVPQVDTFLANINGGVVPKAIDLGVLGETSSLLLHAQLPRGGGELELLRLRGRIPQPRFPRDDDHRRREGRRP